MPGPKPRPGIAPGGPSRQLLSEQTYLALKAYVLDNVLEPGERLNIDALALRLEVSPTPIRESLARLAAEGLVDFESYRGYFVQEMPSAADLADIFEVRKLLETHAVQHAAASSRTTQLVEMERLLVSMGGPDLRPEFQEYREFSVLDQRFHEAIVALGQSPALLEAYRALHVHVQAARFFKTAGLVDVQHSVTEHAAIARALTVGDTQAATEAVRDHIDAGLRRSMVGAASPSEPAEGARTPARMASAR